MLKTLKEYFEEFSILPNPVKMFITAAIFITLAFAVYSGARNFISNQKIERLEKQNFELNRSAQASMEKAAKAEQNAADEALRARDLESKLKTLDEKGKTQDDQIISQTQKSNNLRVNLQRVRQSSPTNTSTIELERRLKERYGPTNSSR